MGGGLSPPHRIARTNFLYTTRLWRPQCRAWDLPALLTNRLKRLFHYSIHFGNPRNVFLLSVLPLISYLVCASISPVLPFRQSRTPSHQPFRKSLTKNASQSVRLLVPHHSGFPIRLYLPYLFRGRYETSLGRLTTLSSSSRP